MNKFRLLTLSAIFVATVQVPAQVKFTSETKLVVVNVSVKDKQGVPVEGLKREDFIVTEDGKPQPIGEFSFEKLSNDLMAALPDVDNGGPKQLEERVTPPPKAAEAPKQAQPAGSVSSSIENSQRKDRRLLAMFFDMTTMPQFDQIRAIENAEKFIREQMTSSDLIQIMNYGTKLNVLQEFTDDRDLLLKTLKNMVVGEGSELAGAAGGAAEGDDTGGFTQDDTEFNIFNTDRQLAAIEDAVKKLAAYPEKKNMIYFSSGISKNGIDNQSQLRAATAAAIRSNVSIYSVDARGLVASAPGGDATSASPRGSGALSGSLQSGRISSMNDTQETISTLAADTGGKVLLDNNDLTLGIKTAQQDLSSYYILGYYSQNSAEDGKYRHIIVKLANPQVAANTQSLKYKEGYYASKVFQKFTAADKEQQLQEALTLGDPLRDLELVLEVDHFRVAQNRYFVPISVKIPGSDVTLIKKGALQSTDFDFVGVVKDLQGRTINNLPNWATLGVRDEIKVDLKDSDAEQLEKHNLQYDTGLTLPPGKYNLRFLARENQTGKMGTYETNFEVPDLSTATGLKLSSIIWSNDRKPVTAAVGTANNDKRATSNHPLIADGQKIVPSITKVFRQDQNMYVYFEVYDPSADAQKAVNVAAEIDLMRGPRKILSSQPTDVTKLDPSRPGVARFTFQIPLAKVPTGQYTAQVNVIDENGKKFAFPRDLIVVLPDQTAQAAAPQPAAQQ